MVFSYSASHCAGRTRRTCCQVHAAAAVQEAQQQYKLVGQRELVKAYKGRAVEVRKGQFIKVINTLGTQVWAG